MANLYTVKKGDSLSIIAAEVLGDKEQWPTLAYMNDLKPPYIIYPGQVLRVPDDEPLTVIIDQWPEQKPATVTPTKNDLTSLPPALLIIAIGVAVAVLLRS